MFWPWTVLLMPWLGLLSWERLAVAVKVYLTQPEAEKLDEAVLSLLGFFPFFCLQNSWLQQLHELDKQGSVCAKFSLS